MTIETIKKAKAHQVYKTKDGQRVPGVTTILGILDKPALKYWANKIGLLGIEVNKYVDELADIGTLTHYRVECEFAGRQADLSDYSANQINLSDNSMLSFYDWQKAHKIEPISNELQLVSEEYGYGGTCDIYCLLDGKKTLIDLKTGKAIYDDHLLQVSAYRFLLIENGYEVEETRILNIPRAENEEFMERKLADPDAYFEIFIYCKKIYDLKKKIGMR